MKYLIAFSGGLDSTVLLYALRHTKNIRAVHVHHGLSPNADHWTQHCKKICAAWKIPLKIIYLKLQKKPQESLEALARDARYQAFQKLLKPGEILVTAHHQNDQAETFLLHAFRGAGPRGLAAMPRLKRLGKNWHWRPLLQQKRETLETFAKNHFLTWIQDESNASLAFDRNFIRRKIIPSLEKKWPALIHNLARAAEIQAELSHFLEEELEAIWKKMPEAIEALDIHPEIIRGDYSNQGNYSEFGGWRGGRGPRPRAACEHGGVPQRQDPSNSQKKTLNTHILFPLTLLNTLSPTLKNWALREWIRKHTGLSISQKTLKKIFTDMIHAKKDKQPELKLGKYQLRRYADALWLVQKDWVFQLNPKDFLPKKVDIRVRQGGERFKPFGKQHALPLKKFLNAQRIPPWLRDQLPLVFENNKLIFIGGINEKGS